MTGPATGAAGTQSLPLWTNPLVEQRADPWITAHDGWFYFTATVPEYDRIELRRARTLDGLRHAFPKVIWRKHPTGIMGAHIWAPELHRIDGRWVIYFAAGATEDIWAIRMYVLENSSPDPLEGEWIERGQIRTGWESFALDATTFAHRGRRYLAWAQHFPDFGGNSSLFLAELETPSTLRSQPVLLSQPELPWETVGFRVNEGPAFLAQGDRVFLTYSASATDANYCLGLLEAPAAADLLDPSVWKKSPEPVFRSDAAVGQFGPGHNCFLSQPGGGETIFVYHARNYRDIDGDPLRDPNRHTRAQVLGWTADGRPDFGRPVPDAPAAPRPLFRDPVFDGAADPVVVWNPRRRRWWMFYTNRRANLPPADVPGVAWVHGTRIGIAESADGGVTWRHHGEARIDLPAELGSAEASHWAPDIVAHAGGFRMFLSVVPGIFTDWNRPRRIAVLESSDLESWTHRETLHLTSDRVIDACVLQLLDGGWRLWYNDEIDGKSICLAESPDLERWTDRGRILKDQAGEGPNVFSWQGWYWMLVDVWAGQAVYRSMDTNQWTRQPGLLLAEPGRGGDDQAVGRHADVVVSGERAFVFYFTHPHDRHERPYPEDRRSSIQVAELGFCDGWLTCDRDAPARVLLRPPGA
ncbi:MAG: alpha-N-arabinofuranosidase [Puniceicoccaceae bacterium]|nr:MAG: alpha-N-arabinofuranosidase [Puniceicoccaceae bacterium]